MANLTRFTFIYPVTILTLNGPVHLDDLTVNAVASLYADGTPREVDINTVFDSDGQDVSKWMPFIDCINGDLNKALEAAAMEHITAKLVEPEPEEINS